VPGVVIRQKSAFYMSGGRPARRGALLHDDDFTILAKYPEPLPVRPQDGSCVLTITAARATLVEGLVAP
jgi:hypothetical protein